MKTEPINMNKAIKEVTMKVELKGIKPFILKLKIGLFLIWLACKIIGCGIETTEEKKNE